MLRTALATALAHKARLALTLIAITLGVAFVAGSFVFTDTIKARFDTLFEDVYAGVDASLRATPDEVASGVTTEVGTIDEGLEDEVAARDDVVAAEGYIQAFGQVMDAEGEPVGGSGPPTYVYSWGEDPRLNPFRIDDGDGRAPRAADELVLDTATAESGGFRLGDRVGVQFPTGTETFDLVGIASFGDSDNLAGATIAVVPLDTAQRVLGLDGRVSLVDVIAADGVDPGTLVERLTPTLPVGVEAVTGDEQTAEAIAGFTEGLDFLGAALLAFAAVAVLVGAFIIHNTFRIVVAQRVRELALLRALGASRRQVVTMVLAEAVAVAVVASLVGLGLGIGVAQVIRAGMDAVGLGPPEGPLTLLPRTVVVALLVGILVTAASALLPAVRASRVAPVAAMQSVAARQVERPARPWWRLGVLAVGAVVVAAGLATGLTALTATGAAVALVSVLLLAPVLTRPVAAVVGSPLRGPVGRLARENATRDPRRTSATASALVIGIALVVFTAIFAASTKQSVRESLEAAFPGDLAVAAVNPYLTVSPSAQEAVRESADVAVASPVRTAPGRVDGGEASVTAVEGATAGRVLDAGATVELAELGGGVLAPAATVEEGTVSLGDIVTVQLSAAAEVEAPVVGTHEGSGLGDWVVDSSTWERLGGSPDATLLLVALADGVPRDQGQVSVESALESFPLLDVKTTSDQVGDAVAQVDAFLVLFTGLLALALLIAVLGIANTLALSVVERTREIGLLRAVGMSRGQVRVMVAGESVVTALFGAVVGSVTGLALGRVVVAALDDQGLGSFAVPVGEMLVWLGLAAVAGVVAAALPARKAARLDVLRAISYE
jgi:putative ABC transport system permease protein